MLCYVMLCYVMTYLNTWGCVGWKSTKYRLIWFKKQKVLTRQQCPPSKESKLVKNLDSRSAVLITEFSSDAFITCGVCRLKKYTKTQDLQDESISIFNKCSIFFSFWFWPLALGMHRLIHGFWTMIYNSGRTTLASIYSYCNFKVKWPGMYVYVEYVW